METNARYILVGLFAAAIIAAGFGFVYWLNNDVGFGGRTAYRIRFEDSVSGLQVGAAVQFNGIRVGEVTGLQLDKDNPRQVFATIAVNDSTPLRADTKVGMTFQGLTGSAAISLTGGVSTSALLAASAGEPPVLVADPGAAQDLTQAVRQALQRVDKILADNSEALKGTIDNLNKFTGALARNSDNVDNVMAGLARLAGGPPAEKPKVVYDLAAPSAFATSRAAPKTQLVVPRPTSIIALQTQRMLARSPDGQISDLGDAQWSDSLPDLVQAKVVQSLDEVGFLVTAAGADQQPASTDRLLIDLRDFAITVSPDPVAKIEFAAKIVDENGHVVATKLFHAGASATGTSAPQIAAAFDGAFGNVAADLANWISQAI
jgi:phospholipid/cholesterol/gamma-HCH transport system substrate-binding protein